MLINQNPPATRTPKHLETQKRQGIYDVDKVMYKFLLS